MNAVVGNAKLLMAVVFDSVFLIKVNDVVVGSVERELFNVFSCGFGGDEGGVDACAFTTFDTRLVGVSFAVGLRDVTFGTETVFFEESASRGLVLPHFVPLAKICCLGVTFRNSGNPA